MQLGISSLRHLVRHQPVLQRIIHPGLPALAGLPECLDDFSVETYRQLRLDAAAVIAASSTDGGIMVSILSFGILVDLPLVCFSQADNAPAIIALYKHHAMQAPPDVGISINAGGGPVQPCATNMLSFRGFYYRLLQTVRDEDAWEEWLCYVLDGVEQTARQTIATITAIKGALFDYKHRIRAGFRFYSQDLINNLFSSHFP